MDNAESVPSFSRLSEALFKSLAKSQEQGNHKKIVVNSLVSKVASWYEKLRNAMDYREEEVVLRAAIERIIKRRILLGGTGKKVAEPLVRELIWARYFADESLSEEVIGQIATKIDLYLRFRDEVMHKKMLKESEANEWMYQLMSSDIEYLLNPLTERELVCNFMFQVMRSNVTITDDTEQNKDVQVFIAVRKAFSKDDLAFLRFHLFTQIFGQITEESIEKTIESFPTGYKEIQNQLSYPRKDRIYNYVKSKTGVFFILDDMLDFYKTGFKDLYVKKEEFEKAVFDVCQARYSSISGKVKRAVIRSVIFILLTKVFFAFGIEGTFENIVYGNVSWKSILLNTTIPPLLMIIASFFLRTPKQDNSKRILKHLYTVLSEDEPRVGNPLIIKKVPDKRPFMNLVFTVLWFLTYLLSFGLVAYALTKLQFNPISQGIFLFFLAIVSFLTYRIGLMSKEYTVEEKQQALAPVLDFFFMPVVRVGRHLTEGISQINVLLFIFDFIIETPFKGIFGFFEQWFFFLRAKREEL